MNNDHFDDLAYEIEILAYEGMEAPSIYIDPNRLQKVIEQAGIKYGFENLREWILKRKDITGSYPSGEEVMDWIDA